jgi:ketosteroid isomerase-like protein
MSTAADERELLEANAAFYRAFATGDLDAMESLWARRAPVACTHPSGETLQGRVQVLAAWRALFGGGGPPPIVSRDATAYPLGEAGFVTCIEAVPGGTLAATNVFAREEGRFRIVHHHAAPIARQLSRPPPKAPPKPPVMN